MKIKILKYQKFRGNKVKVQSYNLRKGKWKENPNYEWHKRIADGIDTDHFPTLYKNETTKEVNTP